MGHAEYVGKFLKTGGKILDVGSGRGKFLCEAAKLGFQVTGLEINPAYIEEAKARASEMGVAVNMAQGRAENMPFPGASFDFVNCAEVTEHVDYPVEICREIFRVLKSGGAGYISFHNRYGVYDYHYHAYFINWMPRKWADKILAFLKKQKDDAISGRQKLSTMHYYTFPEVRALLSGIGFGVEDIRESKIKERFKIFAPIVRVLYVLALRPIYFNTFHVLVRKNDYA